MNANGSEFMLSMRDLAQFLKISPQSVHKLINEKELKTFLIGNKLYLPSSSVRSTLLAKGYTYHKKVISIQMLKGGVGKTSTALNVALRANHYGARVLCLDLDQQGNLSYAFNQENEDLPAWIDVLEGTVTISDAIISISENLDLIPSNLNNSVLDKALTSGNKNIAKAITQYLEPIKDNYDLIIIDTGPNLGAINTAAACCADEVILPVNPDKFSFSGLQKTIDELEIIGEEFNTPISQKVLFTRFDGREASSHELLKKCYATFSEKVLKSFVRTNTDIKNTLQSGKTIFHKNRSTAKEDYDVVTRELIGFDSSGV